MALREFDETMQKLGLEQLDLFLIHWPMPSQDNYVEAWKTLIELREPAASAPSAFPTSTRITSSASSARPA